MKSKVLGILTGIGIIVGLIILTIILMVVVSENSTNPWDGIGVGFMMFFLTGAVVIIVPIIGFVIYRQKQSEYALGLAIGILSVIGFSFVASIVMMIYNAIIG